MTHSSPLEAPESCFPHPGEEQNCRLCPRQCCIDRTGATGFCGAPQSLEVSAICLHAGEEPPLNPIVNIFFSHCNLHCIYCQNHEISAAKVDSSFVHYHTVDEVVERICQLLPQSNGLLGFVTATHYAHFVAPIVEGVRQRGFTPIVVYNSSGYENPDTLKMLDGLVDIYLPDFKYHDGDLARRYSHAEDYPEVATRAILEMKRQVGAGLKCDENGIAFRGLIIRHLVLPGHTDNSIAVLDWIADNLPFNVHVSLMAQYFPPSSTLPSPLTRTLSAEEYQCVADHYQTLGMDGWMQELASEHSYRPNFANATNPFI